MGEMRAQEREELGTSKVSLRSYVSTRCHCIPVDVWCVVKTWSGVELISVEVFSWGMQEQHGTVGALEETWGLWLSPGAV